MTQGLEPPIAEAGASASRPRSLLGRIGDSDLFYSFTHSPVAMLAALVAIVCLVCAIGAPWIAPHDPFDLATLDLNDSHLPPAWTADGRAAYPLGTDDQGRDILSALMFGARISLLVGLISVALAMVIGVTAGLVAGFVGGFVDAALMRLCDVMLSFPSILIALLIDGIGRVIFPQARDTLAFATLILALTLTDWVRYARTVRGSTLVERHKEYVQAARLIGVSRRRILWRHVLPNVLGPVLVLATIQVARDHHGGDAVVPRRRHAADEPVAGHSHPPRQRFPLCRRVVDHDLSRRGPRADLAQHQPARRLAARCAQPEASMIILHLRERAPRPRTRRERG